MQPSTDACSPTDEPALRNLLGRVENHRLHTPESEAWLVRQARRGSAAAVDALVDAHLRRIVPLALRYRNRRLSLMDLIAEGTVGLFRAARSYDEDEDGAFTPHALRAAENRIRDAVGG